MSNKLDRLTNQNMIGKIDYLQVKIDELKTNLTSQESRIQANEVDISENKDNIGNVDDLQIEIDDLKTNLTSQDSRIEAIETGIADNMNVIETNQANISSNSDDVDVIEKKLAALTRAFEMEEIDLMSTDDIETNRGWLTSIVSF